MAPWKWNPPLFPPGAGPSFSTRELRYHHNHATRPSSFPPLQPTSRLWHLATYFNFAFTSPQTALLHINIRFKSGCQSSAAPILPLPFPHPSSCPFAHLSYRSLSFASIPFNAPSIHLPSIHAFLVSLHSSLLFFGLKSTLLARQLQEERTQMEVR